MGSHRIPSKRKLFLAELFCSVRLPSLFSAFFRLSFEVPSSVTHSVCWSVVEVGLMYKTPSPCTLQWFMYKAPAPYTMRAISRHLFFGSTVKENAAMATACLCPTRPPMTRLRPLCWSEDVQRRCFLEALHGLEGPLTDLWVLLGSGCHQNAPAATLTRTVLQWATFMLSRDSPLRLCLCACCF